MHQYAHIHCVSKNLYNQDPGRTPISFGVLDPHMVCKMPFCGVGETQQKSKKKQCFCMVLSSCNVFGCVLASVFYDSFIYLFIYSFKVQLISAQRSKLASVVNLMITSSVSILLINW